MKRNIPLTVDVEPVYDGPVLFQYPVNAVYLLSFQAVLAVVEHGGHILVSSSIQLVFYEAKLGNRFLTS